MGEVAGAPPVKDIPCGQGTTDQDCPIIPPYTKDPVATALLLAACSGRESAPSVSIACKLERLHTRLLNFVSVS